MADAATRADAPDDGQDDVFGGDARRQRAFDGDTHPLGARLGKCLGGQHVFDLGSADAECKCAERTVGGGMAVTTDDGHARQGAALFGPDDMHDALPGVAHFVERDSEVGCVFAHDIELLG